VRLQDENDNNYRLGNRLQISAWGMRRIAPGWDASLRITGQTWGNIKGEDPRLNKTVVPTADPDLRSGKSVDVLAGVNYSSNGGVLEGHTFGIEVGIPAWQDLDGPQLETDWVATAGWQFSFN